jgi:hypothetical protein
MLAMCDIISGIEGRKLTISLEWQYFFAPLRKVAARMKKSHTFVPLFLWTNLRLIATTIKKMLKQSALSYPH